jgi:hypothetical protein
MSSCTVPMISSSVSGRPSTDAAITASTTSPRGSDRRRCAMNSLIQL